MEDNSGDLSLNVNASRGYIPQDDIASRANLPFSQAILQFAAGSLGRGFKLLDFIRPSLLMAVQASTSISSRLQMVALSSFKCGSEYGLVTGSGYTTPTIGTANTGNGASATITTLGVTHKYALFINDSDTTVYLNTGGVAAENGKGIRLNANGGSYEMSPSYGNWCAGAVTGYASAAKAVSFILGA